MAPDLCDQVSKEGFSLPASQRDKSGLLLIDKRSFNKLARLNSAESWAGH